MSKKPEVCVLQPFRMLSFQLFRDWFADACVRAGIPLQRDVKLSWNIKLIVGKLGLCFSLFKRRRLIICTSGKPEYFGWPWCYWCELIPMVWDCWPSCHKSLLRFIKRNKVRTLFCTASGVVDMVRNAIPEVNAIWVPEGIEVSAYPNGGRLVDRHIDVLELGRRMESVHRAILDSKIGARIVHLYEKVGIIFPDFDSMTRGMRDTKIAICYPHSATHPNRAGNIETMTQRYWEFMLSGCVIVGHAPDELVRFCGYNPVIELGDNPAGQIQLILESIERYQPMVDANRAFAETHASWDARMRLIKENLG